MCLYEDSPHPVPILYGNLFIIRRRRNKGWAALFQPGSPCSIEFLQMKPLPLGPVHGLRAGCREVLMRKCLGNVRKYLCCSMNSSSTLQIRAMSTGAFLCVPWPGDQNYHGKCWFNGSGTGPTKRPKGHALSKGAGCELVLEEG